MVSVQLFTLLTVWWAIALFLLLKSDKRCRHLAKELRRSVKLVEALQPLYEFHRKHFPAAPLSNCGIAGSVELGERLVQHYKILLLEHDMDNIVCSQDMITDLLHFIDNQGGDSTRILNSAVGHYEHEKSFNQPIAAKAANE